MRRIGGDERGFTLIELLVASSLMIVVLSAALTSFNRFLDNNRRANQLNDLQDTIRTTADRMAQQLRNLANPTSGSVSTINYAGVRRLVFQTTDPSKQWVSYCLNTQNKIIWYQASSHATIADQSAEENASPAHCPSTSPNGSGTDWTTTQQVGPNITNGTSRPLFAYATDTAAIPVASLPYTSGALTQTITRVTINIFLDNDPTKPPGEANIQTGAYMRNQNQVPTAAFNVFKNGTQFTFDGSLSSDPEDRTLQYSWYRESGTPSAANGQIPGSASGHTIVGDLPDCTATTPQPKQLGTPPITWTCIGTGSSVQANFNGLTSPQNAWLVVVDPGGLADLSDMSTSCPDRTATPVPINSCRSLTFP
jgi:prepilin-type N-terminal cleavage/methylation domain-containing protein